MEGSIIGDCRGKELTRVLRKMEEFLVYGFPSDSPLLVINWDNYELCCMVQRTQSLHGVNHCRTESNNLHYQHGETGLHLDSNKNSSLSVARK